ncbi:hypothetical protein SAMN04487996_103138 [Dyadobacter soli]|uniref:Uncharacterized protein n=1 Tax=Dyadobacter soli TaxID=659014 RepID=A0A1G6ZKN4_9BACT|nr:hypothetical protein SAMN04487996_103138 [Dyadobacter soli]
MNNFFAAFLRIIFAGILGIATVLTTIIMSPFLLFMWVWKKLNDTPPRK